MPVRTADAVWQGTLAEGSGHLKTRSGALKADYTWKARTEEGGGTNPEELLGAAHAGCYSMALSLMLGEAGYPPTRVQTNAEVTFEPVEGGYGITGITLRCEAEAPGIDEASFQEQANNAKAGCPVSKALASVPITLEATLKQA